MSNLQIPGVGECILVHKSAESSVFWAVEEGLNRPLLCKWVQNSCRFQLELELIQNLSKKSYPTLLRQGSCGDRSYWIQEFLLGFTLAHWVQSPVFKGCQNQWVAHIGIQAAKSLSQIHDLGYLHGDLKPEHLYIQNSQKVFWLDLGMAQPIEISVRKHKHHVLGTPIWYSPEQKNGENYSLASEIYVFAQLIFYALTGRPFENKDIDLKDIGHYWHDFFNYCLNPDSLARPEDFEEVVELLEIIIFKLNQEDDVDLQFLSVFAQKEMLYKAWEYPENSIYKMQLFKKLSVLDPLDYRLESLHKELIQPHQNVERQKELLRFALFRSKLWLLSAGVILSIGLLIFGISQKHPTEDHLVLPKAVDLNVSSNSNESKVILKKVWCEIPNRSQYEKVMIGSDFVPESEMGVWLKPGIYKMSAFDKSRNQVIIKKMKVTSKGVVW